MSRVSGVMVGIFIALGAVSCGAGKAGLKGTASVPKAKATPTPSPIRLKWEDRENIRQLRLQAAVANNGLQTYLNSLPQSYKLSSTDNWTINLDKETLEFIGPVNTSGTAKP